MEKKSGLILKLRKKSRQVTEKKSESYGKKVRFKNLNYSEKATKTLNCVHKTKNI